MTIANCKSWYILFVLLSTNRRISSRVLGLFVLFVAFLVVVVFAFVCFLLAFCVCFFLSFGEWGEVIRTTWLIPLVPTSEQHEPHITIIITH